MQLVELLARHLGLARMCLARCQAVSSKGVNHCPELASLRPHESGCGLTKVGVLAESGGCS
jgi:hypothetical protein